MFAEEEAQVLLEAGRMPAELAAMIEQRVAGFALEQIVGWAGFYGLRIAMDPGAFVPWRRTEFLVRQAAGLAPPRAVVLDLCCGSGAVGAALAGSSRTSVGRDKRASSSASCRNLRSERTDPARGALR